MLVDRLFHALCNSLSAKSNLWPLSRDHRHRLGRSAIVSAYVDVLEARTLLSAVVAEAPLVDETFDGTNIGAIPSGWARYSTGNQFEVTGERTVSGSRSLKSTGNSGTHARAWVSAVDHDNVDVSATILVERQNRVGVLSRGTSLDQDDATYWAATIERGLTVSLWKVVDGDATEVATIDSKNWTTNVPIRLTLRTNDDNIRVEAYRTDTGKYLDPEGRWVQESAFAINLMDSSISGSGSVGVVRFAMYSDTLYLDDFSARTVTVESTPPSVSILQPANGAPLSGVVDVNVAASDASGIASVEFLLDGVSRSIDRTGPFSWRMDSSIVPNGTHEITVRATDNVGNVADASVTVSIENETDIAFPEIPRHFNHIRVAGWLGSGPPINSFHENLLATAVDLVKSSSQHLSAIDAVSPSTPQLVYSAQATQLLKTGALIDYLNFADDNGYSREEAFYHVAAALSYSGSSPSSVPVDKFDGVIDAAGFDATENAYSSLFGNDIVFGQLAGESVYVGFADRFREIRVALRSAAAGGYGVVVEYVSAVDAEKRPTAWSTLPLLSDGTSGLTGNGRMLFDPPSDWKTASIDGQRMYWVRFRTTSAGIAPVAATIKGRDYTGASGGQTGIIPAFDYESDLDGDGYLNDAEYAGRESGYDARFDYESRLPQGSFGTGRWRTRPADPGFRAWAVQYHRDALPADADGWFLDNASGNPPTYNVVRESTGAYAEELGMLMNQIWHALGDKFIVPNAAGGGEYTDAIVANSPSYFDEFSIRALEHSVSDFERIANQIGRRSALAPISPLAIIDSHPTNGVLGSDGYWDDRLQIATLAYYYLVADTNTYLSLFVGWDPSGYDWRSHWSDAITHDVGQPVSTTTEFASGIDPADGSSTYKVFGREFENALVLYRPASRAGANRTDAGAVTLSLDGTYRELRADGTLGAEVTQVTLKNNQGAILQRVTNGPVTPDKQIDENFDTTIIGGTPTGWAQYSNTGDNFQVGISHPVSLPQSFVTAGTSTTEARAWLAGENFTNAEVSANVFVRRLGPVGVLARGTDLNTSTPSYWAATIERGLKVSLWKVVDGEATLVKGVQSTAWANSLPVRLTLVADGDQIEVRAFRTDTGEFLNAAGNWNSAETSAISVADAGIPGAGQAGVVRMARYADTIALDNFSATEIGGAVAPQIENFDTTAVGGVPTDWSTRSNTGDNFSVKATHPVSPPHAFVTSGSSTTEAQAWLANRDFGNAEVSATVFIERLNPVGVMARGAGLDTAAPTYWAATIERGLRVSLWKVVNGHATQVQSLRSIDWTDNVPVRLTLVTEGDSIQVRAFRTDTGEYLNSAGQWGATQASAITRTDGGISASGKAGVIRMARYSGSVALDDFAVNELI